MNAVNVTPVAQATSFANAALASCHTAIAEAVKGIKDADKRLGAQIKGLAIARNNTYSNNWFGDIAGHKLEAVKQTTAYEVEHKALVKLLEDAEYSNASQFQTRLKEAGLKDACERGLTLAGKTYAMSDWVAYEEAKKAAKEARKTAGKPKATEYEITQKELTALFVRLHKADANIPEKLKEIRFEIGQILEGQFGLDLTDIC